jgi:hypothetical protein
MHGGAKPVMILARALENNTDEHIDTRMILDKVRRIDTPVLVSGSA